MAILLDTSFYLALVDKLSPNHEQVKRRLVDLQKGIHGKIFTTNLIYSEVMTIINIRGKGKVGDFLSQFSSYFHGTEPIAELIEISKDWYDEIILQLIEEPESKNPITFTDAATIIACRKKHIPKICTFESTFNEFSKEFKIIK